MPEYISSDLQEIAHDLGRLLCGKVPHVVGVSLLNDTEGIPQIYVDIDDESARDKITCTFSGQRIYCRVVGTPQFANVPPNVGGDVAIN